MERYCQAFFYLMVITAVPHNSLGDDLENHNNATLDAGNRKASNQTFNISHHFQSKLTTLEDNGAASEEISTDGIQIFNTTGEGYTIGSPTSHLQTVNSTVNERYIATTTASSSIQSSESLINSTNENVTNGEILPTIPFTNSTNEDTVNNEIHTIFTYTYLGAIPLILATASIVVTWFAIRKRRKRKTSSTPSNSGSNNEEKELSTVVVSPNDKDVSKLEDSNEVSATCKIYVKEPEKTVETDRNESTCALEAEGPYELAKIIRESIIRLPVDSAYDDIDFNPKSMNSLKGPCSNLSQTSLVSANEGEYDILRVAVENRKKQKESIYARVDDDGVYSYIDNAGVESRKNHIGNESDYDDIKLDKIFGKTLTLPPTKKSLSANLLNVYDTKSNFPSKGDYHIPDKAWANLNPTCQDKSKYYRKSNIF